jgi:predicted TIM-barrel fold metal-dependent hydrolase
MVAESMVVDSDGHILEPADLWERYLEKKYVDRAIRIEHDENDLEVLVFDGHIADKKPGTLGSLGGVGMDAKALLTPGERTYEDGWAFGSNNPKDRLKVMDEQGIDISLFYPTLGIYWEGWVTDPEIATAYTRAYNRWIVEFCAESPQRLKAAAHINLRDPVAACDEARRARADGCVGVMLSPDPFSRGGMMLNDPSLDQFWGTLSDLDMPMSFHVVTRPTTQHMLAEWGFGEKGLLSSDLLIMTATFLSLNVMAAFTQMMSAGVFEKFPRLKCGVLESGATWIGAWLDRMDEKYEALGAMTDMSLPPSEYFFRQCVVSADPGETMIADCVRHLGADYFIWASDYPHIDASENVLPELKENLATLSAEDQTKVLGGSAIRFYGL